jgi:hypothetical protein
MPPAKLTKINRIKRKEKKLKKLYSSLAMAALLLVLLQVVGCESDSAGPTDLLNEYFSSAVAQDYATTYNCYYAAYQAKVSKEEYIKHRKEASVLQSYEIISVQQIDKNTAEAEVLLTFASSPTVKRTEPVKTTVKEDLLKENGEWKIKVWH